jgi:competence protein ComEA
MKAALLVSLAAAAGFAQSLPDGPAKPIVERMCVGCHGLENVIRSKRTKDKWGEVVDDMVGRGATGTDAEINQVIDYLAANFGPNTTVKVNVNKAGAAALASGLGISAGDADAIVRYRADKGNFKNIQDVLKAPGIDAKKVEAAQNRMEF